MKLTPKQIADMCAALTVLNEGKSVQQAVLYADGTHAAWTEFFDDKLILNGSRLYRPKPEPQVRAWNCGSDVPIGPCYLRNVDSTGLSWEMIIGAGTEGVSAVGSEVLQIKYADLIYYRFSTTRREDDWHKCEVTEG